MSFDEFPPVSATAIAENPELAMLGFLEQALDMTLLAMPALRPEITDAHPDVVHWSNEPSRCVAMNIVTLANALTDAILLYRRILERNLYEHQTKSYRGGVPF